MTPEEAVGILSKISYRPGWSVHAHAVPGAVVFRVGTEEPDVTKPEERRDVTYTDTVSEANLRLYSRDDLLRWAREVVVRRVSHEVDEWLRFDGIHIYAPHPGRTHGILGDGVAPT
tara:strand:- start:4511 stop:4858 length:348 start_codon:yes stop_codon:yes gene_type:complete